MRGALLESTILSRQGFGAEKLLHGEQQGMATDFTTPAPALNDWGVIGGGNGAATFRGDVMVKDIATPANNKRTYADDFWANAGTSPKLITKADGTLAWSPHNLALQSQTPASWTVANTYTATNNTTTAPDGTATAATINSGATPSTGAFFQPWGGGNIAGAVYTQSVYFKNLSSQWWCLQIRSSAGTDRVRVWVDVQNGVLGSTAAAASGTVLGATITAVGNGWYRVTLTGTISATDATFGIFSANADTSLTAVANATAYIWGAQANRGTVPTAYHVTTAAAWIGLGIDYANSSYGLLVEPAATNLLVQSQALATTWTTTSTIGSDAVVAPDGTTTADKFTDVNNGLTQTLTITANSTYTISGYFKNFTGAWVRLLLFETAASTNRFTGWFNVSTGAAGAKSAGGTGAVIGSTITALANGWYRVTVTGSVGNSATAVSIVMATPPADTGVTNTNDGTSVYFWQAQVELGTVATSPIPTLAATVTRAADDITKAVTATPFNAAVGSMFVEWAMRAVITTTGFSLTDGTSNNRIQAGSDITGPTYRYFVGVAAATQASIDGSAPAAGVFAKQAIRFRANDFAQSVNGATVGTDVSGSIPTVTKFELGQRADALQANGWIKRVIWLPRAWTNAELQAKTA